MARSKEFDEPGALDAALHLFWTRGYGATSVRELANAMGITSASLYNAFGDKRSLFSRALTYYIEQTYADSLRNVPRGQADDAIRFFLREIVEKSLTDHLRKGCMVVNSALEVAPHDIEFQTVIARVLVDVEGFFYRSVVAGQQAGTISSSIPADDLARLLLGVFLGLRVLARSRPERALLEGLVRSVLVILDGNLPGGPR